MKAPISRRGMLALTLSAGAAGIVGLPAARALATPAAVAREVDAFTGGMPVERGRVRLIIADRVENGSAVPLAVEVDSTMEGDDRVESVIVLAEENPNPIVATFHFTALSGTATVSTRIRLAASQKVIAVAKMADGSHWLDEREVDVAIGGCVT
jgi:sulfur-oxidizing protein SoxY